MKLLKSFTLITSLCLSAGLLAAQDWRIEILPDICTTVASGENGVISLRLGRNATTGMAAFVPMKSDFPTASEGYTATASFLFRSGERVTPFEADAVHVGGGLWFFNGDIDQLFRLVAAEDVADFFLGETFLERFSLRGSSAALSRVAECAVSKH